jgi:ribosomal protein S12 methylthiotransferase
LDINYATSRWKERDYRAKFYDLCQDLGSLGAWVRLHYVYPYPHVDEVLPLMAQGKILPYLDIPFQHASPKVLKAMRRPANQEKQAGRIAKWRQECPDLAIRSTFIVGFPGETEEDFSLLLDFMREGQIDRVGCFKYENVVHAASRDLEGHVPEELKEERWHRFMQVAQEVSQQRLATKVGKEVDVIIDEVDDEGPIGRTIWDAPEVDGAVELHGFKRAKPGDIVRARIIEAGDYDLVGEAL